jgi:hypothetical protein
MSIKIKIITNLEEDKELLMNAWSFFRRIPASLELENIYKWWHQFGQINNNKIGKNKKIIIVLIYVETQIRGILPLILVERTRKKFLTLKSLEIYSQSYTGEILDIIHNDLTVREILDTLTKLRSYIKFDYINFSYLPEDSMLLKCSYKYTFLHSGKVIIPIEQNYETIKQKVYTKNLRHVLNKFKKRINESNQKIVPYVLEGKTEIKKYKEEIKQVSLSKLLDKGMHSIYQNNELGELYFDSIINEPKPFCSIYIADKQLLSYNIGYIKNDTVYALDAAYNREFNESQKIGLGILTYDNLVSYFAGNYKWIDMGFGLNDYKFRFSKNVFYTKSLLIGGNTLKAKLLFKYVLKNFEKNHSLIFNKSSFLQSVKKNH